jgi:hypothetical protein
VVSHGRADDAGSPEVEDEKEQVQVAWRPGADRDGRFVSRSVDGRRPGRVDRGVLRNRAQAHAQPNASLVQRGWPQRVSWQGGASAARAARRRASGL